MLSFASFARRALAAAAVAVAFTSAGQARAADGFDVELAAKVGLATNPFDNGANPVQPGVGARAGVSVSRLYLGLDVRYYFFPDQQSGAPGGSGLGQVGGTSTATVSAHALLYGAAAGYDVPLLAGFLLRPQIGVGARTVSTSCQGNVGCGGASATTLYLEPGVTGLLTIAGPLFVGADLNLLLLPDGAFKQIYPAMSLDGQVGVRF